MIQDSSSDWTILGNTGRGEKEPITIAQAEARCAAGRNLAIETIRGTKYLVWVLPTGPTERYEFREVVAHVIDEVHA